MVIYLGLFGTGAGVYGFVLLWQRTYGKLRPSTSFIGTWKYGIPKFTVFAEELQLSTIVPVL